LRKEDVNRFKKLTDLLSGKEAKGKYEYMALCPKHGDARLSLWVKLKDSGKIILHCHAGCSPSDICASIGLSLSFLYPTPQIIDVFDYITVEGQLLYQEIKFDKTALKRFQVRRPSDKKKSKDPWIWDIKDTSLILYNLFEIVNAKNDEIIFMCEGAKDARTLSNLGLISTAALFNDWIKTDTTPLDNKNVIILVDNDEAGETKALVAAHDRYKKSSSIKLLRLPNLEKSEDITDWLKKDEKNTKEELLKLATSSDLKEWFPKESIKERIKDGLVTGLAFEYDNPRPAFFEWLETFHPSEEGPLKFYDDMYIKGNPETKIYKEISENNLLKSMATFFALCYNKKSKNSDELYKPTPTLLKMILHIGIPEIDLDIIENPVMPIFNPFFMPEKEKNYKPEDIIIMKSYNFYVPERHIFPRNMDACISMAALPFDYDENATCPEIDKTFKTQWKNDEESTNLLLQFIYYCMLHTHKYKSLLCMVGESDSGKSQILELIRNFIGQDNCKALSLSKIGRPFELYPARNAQLLISDDIHLTKYDLQDGAIIENLLSIPFGAPIRIEKKGGGIYSKKLPCQIIIAGNNPPEIPIRSVALSNRFKFLYFPHVYIRGKDMNPLIMDIWLKELPGLMNKVLDAGMNLEINDGFIEPRSSFRIRNEFEKGGNPIRQFVQDWFEIQTGDEEVVWFIRISDMKMYYKNYCEEMNVDQLSPNEFSGNLESINNISKQKINVKVISEKTGKPEWSRIYGWCGIRRKGTSGNPNDEIGSTGEF